MTETPETPISDSVCKRLRQAREMAGYVTIREFSDKHGIPYPTYYGHEVGRRVPSLDMITRYADLLGVRRYWLAFGDGPMTPTESDARAPLHEAVDRISIKELGLAVQFLDRLHKDDQPSRE